MDRRIPRLLCAAALTCGLALGNISNATADHHEGGAGHHPPPEIPVDAAKDAISKLPGALQPSYNAALQVDIQTRDARKSGDPAMEMAAGKQMGEAIKAAMQNTIQFLGNASSADADAIAGVLHFFGSGGQADGPAPPGTEALGMAQQMLHDAEMMIQGHPPAGDPNMAPPAGDPNMPPPTGDPHMMPPAGDPNMAPPPGDPNMAPPPGDPNMAPPPGDPNMMPPPPGDPSMMPPPPGDPNMMPPPPGDPNMMPPPPGDPNMMPPPGDPNMAPPPGNPNTMPPPGDPNMAPPPGDPNMMPPPPGDPNMAPPPGDPNMAPPPGDPNMAPPPGDPNMAPPPGDPNMAPPPGDPNMAPPPGDPNMAPPPGDPNMMPPPGDPNMMPPMGDAPPMSPEGALLVGPGMFPNVAPECNDDLRNSELTPQGTHEQDGMTGNVLFRTVCNSPGWENNAITLPAGRNASHFGVEAATQGKIFFGISVEGGAPIWTTADGKAAYDALHLTSAAPSANGKYTIFIDPAKSDPGVRVTVSFVDHQ